MARKRRGLVAAAAAFAASPQGRKLIQQAREYASRPENREKAKQIVADVRARRQTKGSPTTRRFGDNDAPPYGSPSDR